TTQHHFWPTNHTGNPIQRGHYISGVLEAMNDQSGRTSCRSDEGVRPLLSMCDAQTGVGWAAAEDIRPTYRGVAAGRVVNNRSRRQLTLTRNTLVSSGSPLSRRI